MRCALLVSTFFASSCLGPLLPLPEYPTGVHVYACQRISCPREAARIGGIVHGSRYDRAQHVCVCALEDSRNLPVVVYVNPHDR